MARVRQQDTAPELAIRRMLHAHGLRYTLHARGLPGRPDIVLPKRHSVVFVHGCFWHGHDCAHGSVAAKSNTEFWTAKIAANRERDRRQANALRSAGWHVEIVWECEAAQRRIIGRLAARLLER